MTSTRAAHDTGPPRGDVGVGQLAALASSRLALLHLRQVGAVAGRAVEARPVQQRRLGGVAAGLVAGPGAQDRALQRPAEGEAELPGLRACRLMASSRAVACSSLMPPERNTMPGTAAGTVRRSTSTVVVGDDLVVDLVGAVLAGEDHVGLEQGALEDDAVPVELVVDRAQRPRGDRGARSIVCEPSISTSGSTIGVSPASWARAAYRARAWAFAAMQVAVGRARHRSG